VCVSRLKMNLGEKEGSRQSKSLTAAHSKPSRSVRITTVQRWCLLDTNFLGFPSWAPHGPCCWAAWSWCPTSFFPLFFSFSRFFLFFPLLRCLLHFSFLFLFIYSSFRFFCLFYFLLFFLCYEKLQEKIKIKASKKGLGCLLRNALLRSRA